MASATAGDKHPSSHSADVEYVTESARQCALLKRLKDVRALLTVRVPGSDETFVSTVLGVDASHGEFVLDELSPTAGHALLVKSGRAQVQGLLGGVSLRFNLKLGSVGEHRGIAFYRLPLPTRMEYRQRRADFRVRVGFAQQSPVVLKDEENELATGRLRDLSVGGLGASFPIGAAMSAGDTFNCSIDLPDGGTMGCSIQVCHVETDQEHGELKVGARFVHLEPNQRRLLQRCVTALEREMLRRRPPR